MKYIYIMLKKTYNNFTRTKQMHRMHIMHKTKEEMKWLTKN